MVEVFFHSRRANLDHVTHGRALESCARHGVMLSTIESVIGADDSTVD